jgi:MFS family permease
MTFFSDEWAFIESRSLGDPETWLTPHNEHWSTLPILLYRAMVETIGIGSYVPYLATVAVLHVIVAGLVYLLLERSSGPWFALAGATLVLFFGAGFENLYWGFQTGFIGSMAFGLAAMVVTDREPSRRNAAVVAGLLLAANMCSTIGAIVSVAVGMHWLVERDWRPYVPFLLLPAGILLVWLLLVGREGVLARDPLTLEAAATIPSYVVDGFGNAAGSITGLPIVGSAIAFIGLVGILLRVQSGRVPARAIGIVVAVTVQYALTGLVRGLIETDHSDLSRYTYVSGILAMVAVGDIVGRVSIPSTGPRRLATVAGITVWVTLSAIHNGSLLVLGRADMTRALVTVALDPNPPDGAQLDRSLILVPSARSIRWIADAYGDPRTDDLVPFAVRPVPLDILTEATRRLIEGAPLPTE